MPRSLIWLSAWFLLRWCAPGAIRAEVAPKIEPPDVFIQVGLVRAELELIRLELGKPVIQQREIKVTGAAPREVYFQALTLLEKTNRLSEEHKGKRVAPPPLPKRVIAPADVHVVVRLALAKLRDVKAVLKISETVQPERRDDSHDPSAVFRSIVQANRQLNLLLDHRFSPSDVHQEVTQAVGYAARLLSLFPGVTRIPEPPAFERRKTPRDVYERLLNSYQLIQAIGEKSGLSMLEITVDAAELKLITPSDVHDVASLLVSELAYLKSQAPELRDPPLPYYPGKKTPSHVYQRAGLLLKQLQLLKPKVEANKQWLK